MQVRAMVEIELAEGDGEWRPLLRVDGGAVQVHQDVLALIGRAVGALEMLAESTGHQLLVRYGQLRGDVVQGEMWVAKMPENLRYAATLREARRRLAEFEALHPWVIEKGRCCGGAKAV
jgi:hypothetical protein